MPPCLCGCGQYPRYKYAKWIRGHDHVKHGQAGKTPEYTAWLNAKSRCEIPTNPQYENYGGRGIKMLLTFGEFFKELGPRPTGMSLDRINNDGSYESGNIRWATKSQQTFNRRNKSEIGRHAAMRRWHPEGELTCQAT